MIARKLPIVSYTHKTWLHTYPRCVGVGDTRLHNKESGSPAVNARAAHAEKLKRGAFLFSGVRKFPRFGVWPRTCRNMQTGLQEEKALVYVIVGWSGDEYMTGYYALWLRCVGVYLFGHVFVVYLLGGNCRMRCSALRLRNIHSSRLRIANE